MIWEGVAILSGLIWLFLLLGWGQFWRSDQFLLSPAPKEFPSVCAIVPARNEATLLPHTLASLLDQDYPGNFTIVLVDDQSTDGTREIAQQIAAQRGQSDRLQVITGAPLPAGWTGKLWAMHQGVALAHSEYILFTDADIAHSPTHLGRLVAKALADKISLVSVMVHLNCVSAWERLLIPAFVYFFQMVYPFRWVNHPDRKIAAAAGGCILIRRPSLEAMGGLGEIRSALIDDCALAAAVKNNGEALWLGLSQDTRSLRPYPSLSSLWEMVARTAYVQLHYSPWFLLGTLGAMVITFLVPPLVTLGGGYPMVWAGLLPWVLMSYSYSPTLRLYGQPLWMALLLPIVALLYTLMTIDSALRHWRGAGGAWKGRTYPKNAKV